MTYTIIFLFGLVIGSFLNVCIYRIPEHENFVTDRSHCMKCNYKLQWYDMVPVLSYVFLKGKCRKCKEKISIQYPLIELLNGLLYVAIFCFNGLTIDSVIFCITASVLVVISVIDFRIYEIPVGLNITLLIIGIVRMLCDYTRWYNYIIGALCIGGLLYLIMLFSKGRAMGGGDWKLMGAAGLILGWKHIILAFILGCILGSIIHLLRMKISHKDHVLAFGPYLALGIMITMLWGNQILDWYIGMLL